MHDSLAVSLSSRKSAVPVMSCFVVAFQSVYSGKLAFLDSQYLTETLNDTCDRKVSVIVVQSNENEGATFNLVFM